MANNATLSFSPAFCQQFFRNGRPLTGGKLYTFIAGSSTPVFTYKTIGDLSYANRNTNPIILDNEGYAKFVLEKDKSYKFVLCDRHNAVINTWDNVTSYDNFINNKVYGSLQEAIADNKNLDVGMYFETNGFHYSGDGGSCRYLVKSNEVANGMDVILLGDDKFAVAQFDGKTITPQQVGAYADNEHDDTDYIQYAISLCRNNKRGCLVQLSRGDSYKYKVSKNLYIWGGVAVQGTQRWGSWIELSNNASVIFQNSFNQDSRQVEESRLKFVTINGNFDTDYCVQMGTPDHVHTVTQCLMEDVYCQRANIASCYIQGGINYLNHCYFYYSPIGLKTYNVNALYVEECNFWDNTLSVDLDRAQNANFTNDWFEGGTSEERGKNNVQIKVGINTNAFFSNCQFQGSTESTQKILVHTEDESRYNFNLQFDKCRFMYANAVDFLFKPKGYNEVHIGIKNSFFYFPLLTNLIDTSLMSEGSLKYDINNNISYDNDTKSVSMLSDFSKGESQDVFNDGEFKPIFPNGIVLGNVKPRTTKKGTLIYDNFFERPFVYSNYYQRLITGDDFVLAERYGAKGDGVTDDSEAFQEALNYAVGKNKPLLLIAYNYLISADINIKNATTVRGLVRQARLTLVNGAEVKVGLENAAAAEIRIENITIDCSNTSNYGIENVSGYDVQQFYINNFAVLNAVNSNIKLNGTRIYISRGYISDSDFGLDLTGSNIYVSDCYFYRNNKSTHFNSSSVFIENSFFDNANIANAKHISLETSSRIFVNSCCFTGRTQSQKILLEDSQKSFDLEFSNCRFDYTGNQQSLITISTIATDNINLLFRNCFINAILSNYLINNLSVQPGTFGLLFENTEAVGVPAITALLNTYCINLGTSKGPNKTPKYESGVILGSYKPVADSNLSNMDGYLRYDSNINLLQFVASGAYHILPIRATTSVHKLGSSSSLTDVISKINDLITVLSNESKIITY